MDTDGTGTLKNGPQAIGKPRAGWTAKIHMVAADASAAVIFSLSPGYAGDAPEARELLEQTTLSTKYVFMHRAYEGDEHAKWCLISV